MGYTHYYTIRNTNSAEWQTAWPRLVKDARKIVNASSVEIVGDGPTEPPTLSEEDGIYLNGVESEGHEPLYIDKDGVAGFGFVKTARKPYDEVVTCILLRAYMLAPNCVELGSDGHWDEWIFARDLYQYLWPTENILCPWSQ